MPDAQRVTEYCQSGARFVSRFFVVPGILINRKPKNIFD